MKIQWALRSCWVGCCILPLLLACEEKQKPIPEVKEPPTIRPAPTAVATPSPAPVATEAAPTTSERPTRIDTELTPERRGAVETKHPEAKGFLLATELEAKLKADKKLKDKKGALAAFDRAARGKWVLFSGPLVNLTDDGFDLGIVYTPQLPNDPMGMSRQFFEVTLSKIEGYTKQAFKAGNMVVVLAKYNGAGKAGPGYELVSSGTWK